MRQALHLIETSENDTSLAKEEEILDYYAFSAAQVWIKLYSRKIYLSFQLIIFNSFLIKEGNFLEAINLSSRILEISMIYFIVKILAKHDN